MNKKNILITGASSGIGFALTKQLLLLGYNVCAVSRRKPKIESNNMHHVSLDLSDQNAVIAWSKDYASKQNFDAMVYCAGQGIFGCLEQLNAKDFQSNMQVNCLSAMILTKAILPSMKKNNAGKLIYIGSEAALAGAKQGSLYCATKFALRGFIQSLVREVNKDFIGTYLCNLGMVQTSFYDSCYFEPANEAGCSLDLNYVVSSLLSMLDDASQCGYQELNLYPYKTVVNKKKTSDSFDIPA